MGARMGAGGVLIVHETGPAGYPFAIVQGKTAEQFDLEDPDAGSRRVAVEGWITLDRAKELLTCPGTTSMPSRSVRPPGTSSQSTWGRTASVALENTSRRVGSKNVAGRLEGNDPTLKDEWVVYTTHWDHFGIGARSPATASTAAPSTTRRVSEA